ncbi:diaminopimelate decarboxylase [Teredinibacter turnerae]|uniref:diaminopimelate decarboxylase n=1 Tax=Teredinibacter turnerae TaxID=2426 RepID=UPI0005F7CB24|nr:diaminopimelate decarboxylase [Teredinibacter turnerae]
MNLWWEREGLRYNKANEIEFAGQNVNQAAAKLGTPVFLYSGNRILNNYSRVESSLKNTDLPFKIFYALKANRFAPLLTLLKTSTSCGVDVCSPAEVRLALSCGFIPSDISYTGTSVSNTDLDFLTQFSELKLNADGLSMIRRIGERAPGRSIGIRINPAMGTGYGSNELLRYSGEKPTKFGIYATELEEAIALVKQYGLTIDRVHFHTGCGYLNEQLSVWEEILKTCLTMIEKIPSVKSVNLGGGLGIPLTENDNSLDLSDWSAVVKRIFSGKPYEICVEPGTYLVKDAGILVLEANTVETKAGARFIGVNGGFHLSMEPVFYDLPSEPYPCVLRGSKDSSFTETSTSPAIIAGHINEALDVLHESKAYPEVKEGDLLAFINAGAYTVSMSSNHCMRGEFTEYLFLESTHNC